MYCDADCEVDEPEHGAACPSSTGVFPVRDEDVLCHGCKKTYLGMCCGVCEAEFKVGEHYTHRWEEEDVRLVICLGCAAQEAVGADRP